MLGCGLLEDYQNLGLHYDISNLFVCFVFMFYIHAFVSIEVLPELSCTACSGIVLCNTWRLGIVLFLNLSWKWVIELVYENAERSIWGTNKYKGGYFCYQLLSKKNAVIKLRIVVKHIPHNGHFLPPCLLPNKKG